MSTTIVSPASIRSRITQLRNMKSLSGLSPSVLAQMLDDVATSLDLKDKQLRNLASNVLGLLPPVAVDLSKVTGSLTDLNVTGTLSVDNILAGSITTSKLNIADILILGLTVTSNSPAAGRIAWSACTVYVNGVGYPITAGNTATTNLVFVYWDLGGGTFTAATSAAPQANRYLIATNTSGTADIAWNKLASKGVQEANLSFGLITGLDLQPIASATISPAIQTLVNVLTITGYKGGLLSVGLQYTTALVGGVPNIYIRYQIDGNSATDVLVYASAGRFDTAALIVGSNNSGDGSVVGNYLTFLLGFGFSTSLKVDLVATSVAGISDGSFTSSVMYASRAN